MKNKKVTPQMSCFNESAKANAKLHPDSKGSHLKKSTSNTTLRISNNSFNNRKKRVINTSEPPLVNINNQSSNRSCRPKAPLATCSINSNKSTTSTKLKPNLNHSIESRTLSGVSVPSVDTTTCSSATILSMLSDIETAILKSTMPIQIDETEEISFNGERGIWANKSEVVNWKCGDMPLNEYEFNEDAMPEVINKKITKQLEYIQELAIRYLRPPTPPPPGEILIKQETNLVAPPAPPLIIRQQPPRPVTPEPLVIREQPPPLPPLIGRKLIKISGKKLPPPPRKVVIERLAPLPSKPQSVIIERWLPYNDKIKRKVIFSKATQDPVVLKPRNIIVQWEPPAVVVKQDFRYLGTIKANPVEYVQRYGDSLQSSEELPQFIRDIKAPEGLVLASDYKYKLVPESEGDIEALRFVDLEQEGLTEYKPQLMQKIETNSVSSTLLSNTNQNTLSPNSSFASCYSLGASYTVSTAISEIFSQIDTDNDGRITAEEASKILFRLNNRLINNYDETELVNLINERSQDAYYSTENNRSNV